MDAITPVEPVAPKVIIETKGKAIETFANLSKGLPAISGDGAHIAYALDEGEGADGMRGYLETTFVVLSTKTRKMESKTCYARSRMHRILALGCVLVSCATSTSPPAPRSGSPSASASRPLIPPPRRNWAPLREKLERETLTGLALVLGRPMLSASAAAARENATPPKGGHKYDAVRILEDAGDVIRVSTLLAESVEFPSLDPKIELEAWVSKRALVPVLREEVTKTFDDGTGYVLSPGLPLLLEDAIRPFEPSIRSLPVDVDAKLLALSSALEKSGDESQLPPLSGEELGCQHSKTGTRTDSLHTLLREWPSSEDAAPARKVAPELGRGGLAPSYRCSVKTAVQVGGTAVRGLQDACRPIDAWRASGDEAFVAFHSPRAIVRSRSKMHALRSAEGCGSGRIGIEKPAIRVRDGAIAYYPDGTRAGKVHADPYFGLKVLPTRSLDGRRCIKRKYLASEICFDERDVVDIGVSLVDDG